MEIHVKTSLHINVQQNNTRCSMVCSCQLKLMATDRRKTSSRFRIISVSKLSIAIRREKICNLISTVECSGSDTQAFRVHISAQYHNQNCDSSNPDCHSPKSNSTRSNLEKSVFSL
jgi:hypothetical protein